MLDRHEVVPLPSDSIIPGAEDLVQFERCIVDNGVRRACLQLVYLTIKPDRPPVAFCALFGNRKPEQVQDCQFPS